MFYYYATIEGDTINFERVATEDEFVRLEPHISKVSNMLIDKHRINIVVDSYNKVAAEFDEITSGIKSLNDSNDLVFSLTYYLAAFKKYLDNWETYLKRTFGKKSAEVKLFKDAQSNEYDNHMEYRVLYRLRNYDQHCGNLVSRITGSILPDDTRRCVIMADRDRLLNEFDEWKPEEITFLQSCDQYFDIWPFIEVFQKCILNIHEAIIQIHFNTEFYQSCAAIIAAAKEFENEDNTYFIRFVSEIDWENFDIEGKEFLFTYLNVPICKAMLDLFLLNNRNKIKILYCGAEIKKRIGKIAYETEMKKMYEVAFSEPPFVDMCGQKMLRVFSRGVIDKGEIFCVLSDSQFSQKQQREICNTWSYILDSIVKL